MEISSSRGIEMSGGMPRLQRYAKPIIDGTKRGDVASSSRLNTASPRHIQLGGAAGADQKSTSFSDVLMQALESADAIDSKARDLTSKSVFDPDSVEIHEVMIAAEKSRFALNLTKTLADGLVRTFREITNPR